MAVPEVFSQFKVGADLDHIVCSERKSFNFLVETGILNIKSPRCPVGGCKKFMKKVLKEDLFYWRCPVHSNYKFSWRKGSILDHHRISCRQFVSLLRCWAFDFLQSDATEWVNVSYITTVAWFQNFRDVCSWYFDKHQGEDGSEGSHPRDEAHVDKLPVDVKQKLKRMNGCHGASLPSRIDEAVWRRKFAPTKMDALRNIILHIATKHLPNRGAAVDPLARASPTSPAQSLPRSEPESEASPSPSPPPKPRRKRPRSRFAPEKRPPANEPLNSPHEPQNSPQEPQNSPPKIPKVVPMPPSTNQQSLPLLAPKPPGYVQPQVPVKPKAPPVQVPEKRKTPIPLQPKPPVPSQPMPAALVQQSPPVLLQPKPIVTGQPKPLIPLQPWPPVQMQPEPLVSGELKPPVLLQPRPPVPLQPKPAVPLPLEPSAPLQTKPLVQFQPRPRVTFQPKPQVQLQPKPTPPLQPEPLVQLQPRPRVTFQPKPQVQLQPKPTFLAQSEPPISLPSEPSVPLQPWPPVTAQPKTLVLVPLNPSVPVQLRPPIMPPLQLRPTSLAPPRPDPGQTLVICQLPSTPVPRPMSIVIRQPGSQDILDKNVPEQQQQKGLTLKPMHLLLAKHPS